MKLLHITATHLKPAGGVPVVLKELVTEQNQISDFVAKVISVVAPVDEMKSPYFDYVPLDKLESYLDTYKPDFAILHSFYYLEYNTVAHLLNKFKIKYFIEPHGSFGQQALKKSKIKKWIANNTVFKSQIKNAFGFIFLNETERKESIYKTVNDLIIPNGIKYEKIKTKFISRTLDRVFFIGRYDINHKGLDYLLDAIEILDRENYNIEIEFWGNGTEKAIKYLKDRIKKLSSVAVTLNGAIYGAYKEQTLEQLGPMILTSRYEGFPMTILEAWMYGNPCLVTPGTNVADEIKNNNVGWITELNPKDIASSIKKARSDYENRREDYVSRCKQYVGEHYRWDVIAQCSNNLFSRFISL